MKKLLLLLLSVAFSAELVNISGIPLNLSYGKYGNITSFSYKEPGIWNPNAYIKICNLTFGNETVYLDLRYASESGNISESILVKPIKTKVDANNTCKLFDIDLSAFKAIFPAYPFIYLLNESIENITMGNSSYINKTYKVLSFEKLNQSLNGRYKLGISFDNVNNLMYVSVANITFGNSSIPLYDIPLLFISIVKNNVSVAEQKTSPAKPAVFNYTVNDREVFYVNGIPSLRIKPFSPCGKINETGYYVLNSSKWNANETCVVIENTTNVFINFANNTVDGEEGKTDVNESVCGVVIKDSSNVTLFDARVQSFGKDICVINSKGINVIGTYATNSNFSSIYAHNSSVYVSRISLSSPKYEIFANSSYLKTQEVSIPEKTKVSFEGYNVITTDVPKPPPDREGYINVGQFLNVSKVSNFGWVYRITFHYTYPLPNNATHIVYITKVDGKYVNGTWVNLTYVDYTASKKDFSDQTGKLVYGFAWVDLNFTNFSLFIPYALNITAPVPKPTPQPVPKPTPVPTEVPGPQEKAVPPKVNLTLHVKEITLQQGETGEVPFDIKNQGEIDVFNIYVKPDLRYGWKGPPRFFESLRVGERKDGKLYITPYDNEKPGEYFVPIRAILGPNNVTTDVEILKVVVIPRKRVAKVSILEILPYLTLPENSDYPISILVENTGDYNLTNITLSIEGAENCISSIKGSYNLTVGEKKPLSFVLKTKRAGVTCRGIYVLKSDKGVVGVYPVIIKIIPVSELRTRIFPLIYVLWTMLTVRAIYKRRRRKYG